MNISLRRFLLSSIILLMMSSSSHAFEEKIVVGAYNYEVFNPIEKKEKKRKKFFKKLKKHKQKPEIKLSDFLIMTIIPFTTGIILFIIGIAMLNPALWIMGLSIFALFDIILMASLVYIGIENNNSGSKYERMGKGIAIACFTLLHTSVNLILGLGFLIFGLVFQIPVLWITGAALLVLLTIFFLLIILVLDN